MFLSSGSRLGPYEVVSLIGVRGMGEVYRARQASLDRDVALKVLPAALAGDADRLGRFQRVLGRLAIQTSRNTRLLSVAPTNAFLVVRQGP